VHPEDTAVFGGPAMPPAVRGAWLSTLTGSLDRVCLMGALSLPHRTCRQRAQRDFSRTLVVVFCRGRSCSVSVLLPSSSTLPPFVLKRQTALLALVPAFSVDHLIPSLTRCSGPQDCLHAWALPVTPEAPALYHCRLLYQTSASLRPGPLPTNTHSHPHSKPTPGQQPALAFIPNAASALHCRPEEGRRGPLNSR
jgi:hypothetical protein